MNALNEVALQLALSNISDVLKKTDLEIDDKIREALHQFSVRIQINPNNYNCIYAVIN